MVPLSHSEFIVIIVRHQTQRGGPESFIPDTDEVFDISNYILMQFYDCHYPWHVTRSWYQKLLMPWSRCPIAICTPSGVSGWDPELESSQTMAGTLESCKHKVRSHSNLSGQDCEPVPRALKRLIGINTEGLPPDTVLCCLFLKWAHTWHTDEQSKRKKWGFIDACVAHMLRVLVYDW